MAALIRRYGKGLTGIIIALTVFWLVVLVILPYFDLFESSFRPYLPAADVGGPKDVYSLANYLTIFQNPGDFNLNFFGFTYPISIAIHLWVFILTILFSVLTTVTSLLLCYPLAYYMAKVISPKRLSTFLLLLVVPMWVSELLRAFRRHCR